MKYGSRPLVSVVIPAFNEAAILEENVGTLIAYLESMGEDVSWEMIIVNDGSRDETGEIADRLAERYANVHVIHHRINFGLGQAFQSAFAQSTGDYVITLDVDLSYSPEHIGKLLDKIRSTPAKLVLASPYMKGGEVTAVPFFRKVLSVFANRFLSFFAASGWSTLTCMVRAYDGPFIRALTLRATGMDVMPETIYKSMIMRARIEQIPAHLDWSLQSKSGSGRRSSMRVLRHMMATVLSGFLFRPFMFFVLPGLLLLGFSIYTNVWMFIHFFDAYFALSGTGIDDPVTTAVANAYRDFPHTFIVGLLSLMLSIQLISLGVLALQSKAYFEEVFFLGSRVRRDVRGFETDTVIEQERSERND